VKTSNGEYSAGFGAEVAEGSSGKDGGDSKNLLINKFFIRHKNASYIAPTTVLSPFFK